MQEERYEQSPSPKPERKARLLRWLTYTAGFVLTFLFGIFVSLFLGLGGQRGPSGKLGEIYSLIQEYYVDSANLDSLTEQALPLILAQLDPHTAYLNAEENKVSTESLEGSFAGIGVQFNTLLDTVVVVRVIEGGPSERAGLKAGDRILKADTTNLVRDSITSEEIMKALKGPEDTVVRLTVRRGGKTFIASVVRGAVPVSTIDAAYMIRPHVLYLRLNKWGAQTPIEFQQAYADHSAEGVERILIDLRDNVGGYLQAATALATEFLSKGDLLVYNKGAHYPREDFKSPRDGRLKEIPLSILVNENSASASEIFAGAMQDLDRALIVGRRTFGKGLVQVPFELRDRSVVRLTVARYYTPSGRSIQKSYAKGFEAYAEDIEDRYLHGELYSADSISRPDTTRYYTRMGRVVYGGGGITPDIFTPRDSVGINTYYLRLLRSGTFQRFAFTYADRERSRLSALGSDKAILDHLQAQGDQIVYAYASYAQQHGVPQRPGHLQESLPILRRDLVALIADMLGGDKNAYYRARNEQDLEVLTALERLTSPQWRPTK
ncbi:S41 family peptidase [uncultured Porphyromonas sp.]|uniref:S41 family peptidase n=1 Tax=uncultured Porphyromonas sp. TaxID=159274 RepID=UPI0026375523|nr:S41 family peptidase [uncultured Porphyromonas sp.]